jgi:hypothetical protein
MHPASRDSSKCDEHEIRRMSVTLSVDANVKPYMLVNGDRWLIKTRFDAQYEHGIQPVGMQFI